MSEGRTVDVVVIGGGPAGTTAATLLRRDAPDLRVVLVERAQFPRHHVGESMLPESGHILAKMGVAEQIDAAGFLRKGGATFNWRADAVETSPGFRSDHAGPAGSGPRLAGGPEPLRPYLARPRGRVRGRAAVPGAGHWGLARGRSGDRGRGRGRGPA